MPEVGDRLELVLASIADHLVVDVADEVAAIRVEPLRRRAIVVLAAAVVVALVGIVTIAPAREAVARWLGIGTTRVKSVPIDDADPSGLPRVGDTSSATAGPATSGPASGAGPSNEAVELVLGGALPDTSGLGLGPPDELYLPPEGGVLLVWSTDETTLWIRRLFSDVDGLFTKLVAMGEEVRFVDDLGDGALVIIGDHVLATPRRRFAAGTAVLWTDGPYELRLEAGVDPDLLVTRARQINVEAPTTPAASMAPRAGASGPGRP